jgi:hypothetical protein
MQNLVGYGANTGCIVPYTYSFDTLSYVQTTNALIDFTPVKKFTSNSNLIVFENPTFIKNTVSGNVINLIYALYKIPNATFNGVQIYKDTNNLYRLSYNDYSILVD